jgi:hypothetical protein
MGHTRFSPKETNFTSFFPQGRATAPEIQAKAGRAKHEPLQQEARQMPGFLIFGDFKFVNIANRTLAAKTPFVEDSEYLNLRWSLERLHDTWADVVKTYILTPRCWPLLFRLALKPRRPRRQSPLVASPITVIGECRRSPNSRAFSIGTERPTATGTTRGPPPGVDPAFGPMQLDTATPDTRNSAAARSVSFGIRGTATLAHRRFMCGA